MTFTDSFAFLDPNMDAIEVDEDNIAWKSDKDLRFKNLDKPERYERQWIDIEDEHFIVWMRLSGQPTFRKLYGTIDEDLDEGSGYTIRV